MISLIIINYNGKEFANKLINSIKDQTYKEYEIIVVDNNSKHSLYKTYIKNFSKIKYIYLKKNMGFPYAVNLGVKYASSDNIVLLNNDIYIEKDFLERAIFYLKKYKKTFFAPLVMDYNCEYIDSAGDSIPFDFKPVKKYSGKTISHIKENMYYTDGFSMSACFFHKKDFIKNNGLNNNYFLYFEDVDFSIRAKNNGFNIIFVKDVIAYHYISAGTKKQYGSAYSPLKVFFESKNRFSFAFNNNKKRIIQIFFPFLLGTLSSMYFHIFKTKYIMEYLSGLFYGMHYIKRNSYYDKV